MTGKANAPQVGPWVEEQGLWVRRVAGRIVAEVFHDRWADHWTWRSFSGNREQTGTELTLADAQVQADAALESASR